MEHSNKIAQAVMGIWKDVQVVWSHTLSKTEFCFPHFSSTSFQDFFADFLFSLLSAGVLFGKALVFFSIYSSLGILSSIMVLNIIYT